MSEPVQNFVAIIENAPDHPWGRKFKPLQISDARFTCCRFDPGTKVVVSIKKYREDRSIKQNAYYWAVVLPAIMDASGDDPRDVEAKEELHTLMKAKFNTRVRHGVGGQIEDVPQSTTKLDTKQFTEFLDAVIRWGQMFHGAEIPPPSRSHGVDGLGI